jgi:hypothetical protein
MSADYPTRQSHITSAFAGSYMVSRNKRSPFRY